MRTRSFLPLFICPWLAAASENYETDICVYGGTAGGVAASVESAYSGKRVLLLEPGRHLGGMTSGGLGQTDIGNKGAIGGLSRQFYRRVGRHYQQAEQWTFEPHVAEDIFFQWLNESKVPVYFDQRLAAVTKEGPRIRAIRMESGKVIRAAMFIDATYEGDLMARAGVSYTVGRESNTQYGETLNGVRPKTPQHQFVAPVDPYLRPGDSASGLIPLIQPDDGGAPGASDHSVQAYNFRLVLTRDPQNKKLLERPPRYASATYELAARYAQALAAAGKHPKLGDFMHIQMMPHGKTDINNNGGISTDFIGASSAYPDADYASRAAIWKAHELYTRGLLYFLANDDRVPPEIRQEMQSWGLTGDEFLDTDGWPHQLYVREARRMISDYVMTEMNCRGSRKAVDSVGLAAYGMDSHNCQRLMKNGRVENEGDVQVHGFKPYPIAYRSIIPKAVECENLVVPICLSATHIAYGSIRMEPVFMVLGHSAAAAAAMAIDSGTALQAVEVTKLQQRLLAEHQVLSWKF